MHSQCRLLLLNVIYMNECIESFDDLKEYHIFVYMFRCSCHQNLNIECEIIINREVLIFVYFVVSLNHEKQNPTKYNFPIDCCLQRLKPRIQDSMINTFCGNHEKWCQ